MTTPDTLAKLAEIEAGAAYIEAWSDGDNTMDVTAKHLRDYAGHLRALTAQAPADFPPRVLELLHQVADRNPGKGFGPWEDEQGEPMQDDADAALAWIAAQAPAAAEPEQGEPFGWIYHDLVAKGEAKMADAVRFLISSRKGALEDAARQSKRRLEVQAAQVENRS